MTNTKTASTVSQWDIWLAEIPENMSFKRLCGQRPVIVVSNGFANRTSPTITVIPVTSNTQRRKLATHVAIEGCGLRMQSIAHVENVSCIAREWLKKPLGHISDKRVRNELHQKIEYQFSDAGEEAVSM